MGRLDQTTVFYEMIWQESIHLIFAVKLCRNHQFHICLHSFPAYIGDKFPPVMASIASITLGYNPPYFSKEQCKKNSLTEHKGSGGNRKLPPRGIPMVEYGKYRRPQQNYPTNITTRVELFASPTAWDIWILPIRHR